VQVCVRHLRQQGAQIQPFRGRFHDHPPRADREDHRVAFPDVNLLGHGLRNAQRQTAAPFLNRRGHVSTLKLRPQDVNLHQHLHQHDRLAEENAPNRASILGWLREADGLGELARFRVADGRVLDGNG